MDFSTHTNNDPITMLCRVVHGSGWVRLRSFFNLIRDSGLKKIQLNPTHYRALTQPNPIHVGWVGLDFFKLLLLILNWELKDNEGFTALACATYSGNYRIAECMLGKNENLISIRNNKGQTPVVLALFHGHLKLARYLYFLTPLEILLPENGTMGATVVCEAIYNNALGKN